MTAPTNEQWTAMNKLVQSMFQRADCEPFRVPVDWKGMGLFDYPQIIKKPMDLGTVKKNIVARKYKTISEAAEDVRLVWKNCMSYNQDGSDFFVLAEHLSKKFEEKYAKLVEDHKIDAKRPDGVVDGVGATGMVTLEEKKAFARSLYKISKEDLGKVIVEVDVRCPVALTKSPGEDEAELNLDKLSVEVFRELSTFVQSCVKAANSTKKVAKKKQ